MKIKDIAAFFASLDQEADVLMADYYYSDREGFAPFTGDLSLYVARPAECPLWMQHYPDGAYLMDFYGGVRQ